MTARFFFSNDVGGFQPGLLCHHLQRVRVIGVKNMDILFEPVVEVTLKSPIVSKLFNSQRHHIQSKMQSVHTGEKLLDPGQSLALNDSLTMVH